MPFQFTVVITKQDAATPVYWKTIPDFVQSNAGKPGFVSENTTTSEDGKVMTHTEIWDSEADFQNATTANYDRKAEQTAYNLANNITVVETRQTT